MVKWVKATDQSEITADVLKADGDESVEIIRQLTEAVFCSGNIRTTQEDSYILNLYKGRR